MSVLSAQCDALRACAQNLRTIAGNPAWQEANEMDKAADTIWRLRNQNLELRDKIDELEEQNDHMRSKLHTLQSEEERLTEEGAELRELCADVWMFTYAAREKYPRLFDQPAQGGQTVRPNMLDEFSERIEALGIEVDG